MFCYRNNCGCNNCGCNNCGCNNCGCSGQRGPAGPQGPTGTVSNINTTLYNSATQTVTANTPLTFPNTLTNTGFTTTNNSVTIPTSGTYLVSYGINSGADTGVGEYVGVAVNGTIIPATEREISTTLGTTGTYVINLNTGDVITLVPVTTDTTAIANTGGPSVYLTVSHIA